MNGAKTTKRKYVALIQITMAERYKDIAKQPSWHDDKAVYQAFERSLSPIAMTSGYNPEAVKAWLEASGTKEDIATFLHNAEAIGLKQPEQIVLAQDFAGGLLILDLMEESSKENKDILLNFIVTIKDQGGGSVSLHKSGYSMERLKAYFKDRGGVREGEGEYWTITMFYSFRSQKYEAVLGGEADGLPWLATYAQLD